MSNLSNRKGWKPSGSNPGLSSNSQPGERCHTGSRKEEEGEEGGEGEERDEEPGDEYNWATKEQRAKGEVSVLYAYGGSGV
jgi:hypothetical protein